MVNGTVKQVCLSSKLGVLNFPAIPLLGYFGAKFSGLGLKNGHNQV